MRLYDVYLRTSSGDRVLAGSFLAESPEDALEHLPPPRTGERYMVPEASSDPARYEIFASAISARARQARDRHDWIMEQIWSTAASDLRRQSATFTAD